MFVKQSKRASGARKDLRGVQSLKAFLKYWSLFKDGMA